MVVGIMKIRLYTSEPRSLKDKRHIIKSLLDRLKNKFNIAAAETGLMDSWNNSEIGVVCVSNESSHADGMMASVINFIECNGFVEITDYTTELVHTD